MSKASSPFTFSHTPNETSISWSLPFRDRLQELNTDLWLQILNSKNLVIESHLVTGIYWKALALKPGSYKVRLLEAKKKAIQLESQLTPCPSVLWFEDSPAHHFITWQGIPWKSLRLETTRILQQSWDEDLAVYLEAEDTKQQKTYHNISNQSSIELSGSICSIELFIAPQTSQSKPTKLVSIVKAHQLEGTSTLLYEADLEVEKNPQLNLEPYHDFHYKKYLKATWKGVDLPSEFRLDLYHNRQKIDSVLVEKTIPDYRFPVTSLTGHYEIKLHKPKGKKSLLSTSLDVSTSKSGLYLLPVSLEQAYATWNFTPEQLIADYEPELKNNHSLKLRILKWEDKGSWNPLPFIEYDIDLTNTQEYFLKLPSDQVYRAEFILRKGSKVISIMSSGPCQFPRAQSGNAPLRMKPAQKIPKHPSERPLLYDSVTELKAQGTLLLHLHAHLPYIPDPIVFESSERFIPSGHPQEWYPEAAHNTYIPLLRTCYELRNEHVDYRLSLDISPPLLTMMAQKSHRNIVIEYLRRLEKLALVELARTTRTEPWYREAVIMHLNHIQENLQFVLGCNGDLIAAFRTLQEEGFLELSTCIGFHPLAPMWMHNPQVLEDQIAFAQKTHTYHLQRPANGIWLPECAYTPGIEDLLQKHGLHYYFSESDTVLKADSYARSGIHDCYFSAESNVRIFGRDEETSRQVWSGNEGYPGDPDYLDFHIKGGPFRYQRITDRKGGYKEAYRPTWARNKTAHHAEHYIQCRKARFYYLRQHGFSNPLSVATYDAELFGHHWFEGPEFIRNLFLKLHHDQNQLGLTTPTKWINQAKSHQALFPNVSSWGASANFQTWVTESNAWMYQALFAAGEVWKQASKPKIHAKRQCWALARRGLLIAMASDLPFVIANGHFVDRMLEYYNFGLEIFHHYLTLSQSSEKLSKEQLDQLENLCSLVGYEEELDLRQEFPEG